MVAEDTDVLTSSHKKYIILRGLQNHINILEEYYNKWKIKINEEKTEILIFSHKRDDDSMLLKINKHYSKHANKAKYLGLILDKKITYTEHIKSVLHIANAVKSILCQLICRNSHVNTKN